MKRYLSLTVFTTALLIIAFSGIHDSTASIFNVPVAQAQDDGAGEGAGEGGSTGDTGGDTGCGNGDNQPGSTIASAAIKELTFLPDSPHDPSTSPIDYNHFWYFYTPSGEAIDPPARVIAARTTIPYNTSTTLRWKFIVEWNDLSPVLPPNARCEAAEAWSGDKPLAMVGPMGFGGGGRTVDFIGSESTGNLTSQKVYDLICSVTQYGGMDSYSRPRETRWFAAREIIVDVQNACYPSADPAGYGTACTSAANACGQTQSNGTIQCDGTCSSTPPAVTTPTGATYGADCQSPVNSCGASSAGTITCAGTCSATTAPPTSACNKADLTAGAASPASATVGAATTLSATISNISGPATGGEFTDSFQINPGSIPATFAEIQAIRTYLSANLSSGGSNTATASYTFGSAGTWYVRACADLDASNVGTITESNESNNCSPSWTAVTVGSCSANQGNACTSSANSCGQTASGTIQCNGSCSASSPPDSNCPPPPPTATLTADDYEIDVGQSTVLRWNSTNASSCAGTGFSTGGATSGNVSTGALNTPGTQNYQVNCSGAMDSASIEVLAPGASIEANPARVISGGTTALTWSANGVQSCAVSGPGVSVPNTPADANNAFSGNASPTITAQSTYTITCQTNGSPVTDSVTVNIGADFEEF